MNNVLEESFESVIYWAHAMASRSAEHIESELAKVGTVQGQIRAGSSIGSFIEAAGGTYQHATRFTHKSVEERRKELTEQLAENRLYQRVFGRFDQASEEDKKTAVLWAYDLLIDEIEIVEYGRKERPRAYADGELTVEQFRVLVRQDAIELSMYRKFEDELRPIKEALGI